MALSEIFQDFIRNTTAEEKLGVSQRAFQGDEAERLYQMFWNPTVKLQRIGSTETTQALIHFRANNDTCFLKSKQTPKKLWE